MSSREQFEAWASDEWKFPFVVERSGDSYKFMATQNKWEVWQAATNAMEAKCAALAAENAALKSALNPEVIPDAAVEAFTETAIMDHDWNETGEWSWVENDADVIRAVLEAINPETPATDAFLAEVRASAADEVCLKISNAIINCYQDEQVGLDEAATICGDFAAQLRQGGAK